LDLTFDDAIQVGRPSDLIELQRGAPEAAPTIPVSTAPRGLALTSLRVTRNWDGLWGLLGRRQDIYFLSVAFDISEHPPVVLPPAEVPADAVHRVHRGEAIQFTLGDGAPMFLPRVINGGLIIYITVCEADKGTRHVGEVLARVHEDLAKDRSLVEVLTGFIKNPGSAVADEVLKAATAALQPIATVLKSSSDEYVGLFSGIYPARGPWRGRLTGTSNGTVIELRELR
jgi:hypothetical protein